jgi:site-specific recombinase XerD
MSSKTSTKTKMSKVPLTSLARQYVADLRLRNLSEHTLRTYQKVLRLLESYLTQGQPNAEVPLHSITPARVKEYIAYRQSDHCPWQDHPLIEVEDTHRRLSDATIHQDVRSLKSFGNWLQENGYVYNPDSHIGARWQAILAFALDTGARLNEVVGLTMDNLDLKDCRAKILGKGNKERIIRFGSRCYRMLSRYLNLYRPSENSERVFVNLDGSALTPTGLHDIIRNARAKADVRRFHFHLLRHTFATNFLLAGGDSLELKDLLGHTSLAMTDRYVHLARQLSRSQAPLHRRHSVLDHMSLDLSRQRHGRGGRRSRSAASGTAPNDGAPIEDRGRATSVVW